MEYTFEWDDCVFQSWTVADALVAGVPQGVIDGVVQDHRRADVNAECKRRIYAVASPETQMNMATASAVISGKSTSSRTEPEKAVLAGVAASLGWVEAMRTAAVALIADQTVNAFDDAAWPACPDDVLAVVGQF